MYWTMFDLTLTVPCLHSWEKGWAFPKVFWTSNHCWWNQTNTQTQCVVLCVPRLFVWYLYVCFCRGLFIKISIKAIKPLCCKLLNLSWKITKCPANMLALLPGFLNFALPSLALMEVMVSSGDDWFEHHNNDFEGGRVIIYLHNAPLSFWF